MSRFKLIGRKLDLEFGDNLNENFNKTDADLTTVETRVNNLILNNGDSSAEVIDARLGADGETRTTLGEFVREIHQSTLTGGGNASIDDTVISETSTWSSSNISNKVGDITTLTTTDKTSTVNAINEQQNKISVLSGEINSIITKQLTNTAIKKLKTIIPLGSSTEWDENIREIGNFIYDEEDLNKPYKIVYSGHQGIYVGNNVYVGYAYSNDGINWIKGGKVTSLSSEDPYLVKENGVYYLFVEDKSVVPFKNIRLYTSNDFNTWNDEGIVLDIGTDWESQDVSSPVVWIENEVWYMLYEGRGGGHGGAVGLATSNNGLVWSKSSSNPVLTPNKNIFIRNDVHWAEGVVPDDIKKINGKYLFIFHGSIRNSIEDLKFLPAYTISEDLINWTVLSDLPISIQNNSDTIMFINYDYLFVDSNGISIGVSSDNKSFTYVKGVPSTAITLTTGTWTKITHFDSKKIDSRGEFDVTAQSYVPKYSGVYYFRLRMDFNGANVGSRIGLRVNVNGVEAEAFINITTGGVTNHIIANDVKLFLFAGDIVEFNYYTNSSNAVTSDTVSLNVTQDN